MGTYPGTYPGLTRDLPGTYPGLTQTFPAGNNIPGSNNQSQNSFRLKSGIVIGWGEGSR